MRAGRDNDPKRLLAVVSLCLATALSSVAVNPAAAAATLARDGAPNPGAGLLMALGGLTSGALNQGADGRITILLLGSDSRVTTISRTDSIMIVSLKGSQITAASIPRDTGRIPNPAGGRYVGRVNALIKSFILSGLTRDQALAKFEKAIEYLLGGIEIDYYVVTWFTGVTDLVETVDPITVDIAKEIRDPRQIDDPGTEWGVYFPQRAGYQLFANNPAPARPRCNGLYKFDSAPPVEETYWCRRALPFVRSRKGPGNNDFARARRQQDFVYAAIQAVNSEAELAGLINVALSQDGLGKWITNIPVSLEVATDLYTRLQGATLANRVVFKPTLWAKAIPGSTAFELKLPAVRSWAATYLK